ncbi:hypothetical protein [Enterobacter hormaechei]|uniref:hypothetical protein n=1 Tax=Enterobacter hormaechei TaxID=158836 RepID=UPI002DB8DCD1|nr:hypothetical protein [Enterobacter hormaechei]MEB7645879.1 hypothetical protein [Enterobacter hormaechei]
MSNIDKQAVQAVADLKAGYTLGHADVEIIQQMALDAVTLLDELEAAEKLIAELETREVILPQRMDPEGYHIDEAYMVAAEDGEYLDRDEVIEAMRTAGIRINGEG